MAAAAAEYTEWEVFALWVRAVVEATGSIPAMVAQEMESRTPLLLAGIRPDLDAAVRNGSGPGARIWEDVSLWTEMNFFIAAKRAAPTPVFSRPLGSLLLNVRVRSLAPSLK